MQSNNKSVMLANLRMLEFVAAKLGEIRDDVVFLGGCTTGLLTDKMAIKIVTAPYFLATKLEAFKTRGKSDYYVSHDFEDIVSILDGRVEIVDEIHKADSELRDHLINSFTEINNSFNVKENFGSLR